MKIIRIDGIIGDFMNTLEDFRTRVEGLGLESGEGLTVVINSIGGSVFEGFGIYNYLLSLPHEIYTEVEGLAASISTLIASAAKKENSSISEVSMWMVHKSATGAHGNADELEKQIDVLKSIDETLISVYAARTGKTRKAIENLLSKESWYTGKEAVKEGFVGNLINRVDAKMAAMALQTQIQNNMKGFKNLLSKYSNAAAPVVEAEVVVENAAAPVVAPVAAPVVEGEVVVEAQAAPVVAPAIEGETLVEIQAVTIEMFNELALSVTNAVKMLNETVALLAEQTPIEDQVKTAFTAQLKTLPTSNGNPKKPQSVLNKIPNTYVQKNSNFKARMKEIEAKTRLS